MSTRIIWVYTLNSYQCGEEGFQPIEVDELHADAVIQSINSIHGNYTWKVTAGNTKMEAEKESYKWN